MERPLLITVTPVRNEAWVLDAHLACVSSWADYIILADQHSTDGSREIAKKYPKVILIDNPYEEMNQAAARRLLFSEVDKIKGDKIVFALDADEFLSPGFAQTDGWHSILKSSPNSVFCFKWFNLYGDFAHALPISDKKGYAEWACHFSSDISLEEEYFKREKNAVHETRIPCLSEESCRYYLVDDIRFVHLAKLNLDRTKNKEDFYQVSTIDKRSQSISSVSLYRTYHRHYKTIEQLQEPVRLLSFLGEDCTSKVILTDIGSYYIDEIISILNRRPKEMFKRIDIWNNKYLIRKGVTYMPSLGTRILFLYLKLTSTSTENILVRGVDAILKKMV